MGYTSESIYWVYFSNSRRIKTVQDLEFDESYNNEKIGTIAVEEPFFSFSKLEFFTNSTYNTPVREEEELSTIPPTPPDTYRKVEDDNSYHIFSAFSDNDTSFLWRLSKICYESTRYGLVAQYIAFLSIAQSEICESLSYNKAIQSLKAHL